MSAAVRFDQVSKVHPGGTAAIAELSFSVDAGEMVFVAGHSGAGKSTLLKLIALIEKSSSGTVEVLGQDLSRIPRAGLSAHRRRLGLVFQDHRLLLDRTVFDNVALPLVVGGLPHADGCVPPHAPTASLTSVGRRVARPAETVLFPGRGCKHG